MITTLMTVVCTYGNENEKNNAFDDTLIVWLQLSSNISSKAAVTVGAVSPISVTTTDELVST